MGGRTSLMRSGFIRLEPFASVSDVTCRDEIVQVTDWGAPYVVVPETHFIVSFVCLFVSKSL